MVSNEKFAKILEKLTDAAKKSGEGRSKQALAVQIVDKTGKIEGGKASSVEQEREKATQSKNQTSFLKRIAEGISNIPGAAGDIAAGAAESMFDKLKKAEGTLGKLINDDTIHDNMNSLVTDIRALVQDFKDNPTKYMKAYWKGKK